MCGVTIRQWNILEASESIGMAFLLIELLSVEIHMTLKPISSKPMMTRFIKPNRVSAFIVLTGSI